MFTLARTAVLALLGAGSLAAATGCPVVNASVVAHTGTPVGKEEAINHFTQFIQPSTVTRPSRSQKSAFLSLASAR